MKAQCISCAILAALKHQQRFVITHENLQCVLTEYESKLFVLPSKPTIDQRIKHDSISQIISSLKAVLPLLEQLSVIQDKHS
jgi:hypothetical protein